MDEQQVPSQAGRAADAGPGSSPGLGPGGPWAIVASIDHALAQAEAGRALLRELVDLAGRWPDAAGEGDGDGAGAPAEARQALQQLARRAALLLAVPAGQAVSHTAPDTSRLRLMQFVAASTQSLDLQAFIDRGYVYRYVNERHLAYWGCTREQIEGRTVPEVVGADVFDRQVRPMLDRALAGELVVWEITANYLGAGRRHVRVTFVPAREPSGEVFGAVMRVEDLDELVETRNQLHASVARLERLAEQQQAFIRTVSHDLREPLNGICNLALLLQARTDLPLDAKAREYLGHIAASGRRMDALIASLLAYVRLEEQPLKWRTVPLDEVMAAVMADLRAAAEQAAARAETGALPAVEGDESLLRLVLQNLVSNALKYHRPGQPPHVQVYDASDAREWRVAVQDRGIGIEAADQGRLFALFARVGAGRERPGTGLGLAGARRIAELHGGRIELCSSPGVGSTFFLCLPRAVVRGAGGHARGGMADEAPSPVPGP